MANQKGDILVRKDDNYLENKNIGTDGQVLTADSTDDQGMSWQTSSSSLNYFTELSGSDYGDISSLQPSWGTDTSIILSLSGSGSLLTAIPDGTLSGGVQRGVNAVDLQLSRTTETQVASGDYSTIIGGSNNTAGGDYSIITGKDGYTTVYGAKIHSTGTITDDVSNIINIQKGTYILRGKTIDDTPINLTTNELSASNNNQIALRENQVISFQGDVSAKRSGEGMDISSWQIEGVITSVYLSSDIIELYNPNNWSLSLSGDNINNALGITFTGDTSGSIGITAAIDTLEVKY